MEDFPWEHKGNRNQSNDPIMQESKRFFGLLRYILLTILVINFCQDNSAQVLGGSIQTNEALFLARIKQFNEFLDRFNYKTDLRGNLVDSEFIKRMPREKYLNSLFNLKDPRLQNGSTYSESYAAIRSECIADVLNNDLTINKNSGNIIAEAKSKVILNRNSMPVSIFLVQETLKNGALKWVMIDVKGEIFNFLKIDSGRKHYLSPASNETDFIDLKTAMAESSYIHYYASEGFKTDRLSVFFYMLNAGIIKFDYVEAVYYHVLDIRGWCIKVKDFNRNEMNSGWLIYDISKNKLPVKDYIDCLL
jgi:hypothetical protein